jgi:hypothetical protein
LTRQVSDAGRCHQITGRRSRGTTLFTTAGRIGDASRLKNGRLFATPIGLVFGTHGMILLLPGTCFWRQGSRISGNNQGLIGRTVNGSQISMGHPAATAPAPTISLDRRHGLKRNFSQFHSIFHLQKPRLNTMA